MTIKLLLSLARSRFDRAAHPGEAHFLRDYRRMVRSLKANLGYEAAMQAGVGGDFENVGRCEAALLMHYGLGAGGHVVDVGCGSGRLAHALGKALDITYHGCDIISDFLDYARSKSPAHYRFTVVSGLTIPEPHATADFVVFFSVATHLFHHETFLYLEEARRVAKPGGRIFVSFLEFADDGHWPQFMHIVDATRSRREMHLNAFIEASVFPVWARRLGLEVEAILPRGRVSGAHGDIELGQSVAILRKPGGTVERAAMPA